MTRHEQVYFVKRFTQKRNIDKIQSIHKKLQQHDFLDIVPIEDVIDYQYIVQKWQSGSYPADFSLKKDRTVALQLLNRLHATAEHIHWKNIYVIPQTKSLLKWQFRLQRFQQAYSQLSHYIADKDLQKIMQYGEWALYDIQKAEQNLPPSKLTLLHGDVAHHNFLIRENGDMCLIDFDMAYVGNADDEVLLWVHRVLPQMNYRVRELMEEQSDLANVRREKWHRLKYPNELLREWLLLLKLQGEEQELLLQHLLPFTKTALSCWGDVWHDSERFATKR